MYENNHNKKTLLTKREKCFIIVAYFVKGKKTMNTVFYVINIIVINAIILIAITAKKNSAVCRVCRKAA